jgi:hypothetical protein
MDDQICYQNITAVVLIKYSKKPRSFARMKIGIRKLNDPKNIVIATTRAWQIWLVEWELTLGQV